jgi:hypothetical protein
VSEKNVLLCNENEYRFSVMKNVFSLQLKPDGESVAECWIRLQANTPENTFRHDCCLSELRQIFECHHSFDNDKKKKIIKVFPVNCKLLETKMMKSVYHYLSIVAQQRQKLVSNDE